MTLYLNMLVGICSKTIPVMPETNVRKEVEFNSSKRGY